MSRKKVSSGAAKRPRLSYERRKALYGYGFISLWLLGTIWFFLIPLGKSLIYSFNSVGIESGHMTMKWSGLDNYSAALNKDQYYVDHLEKTLLETLWRTPLILIFSLFIAVVLNQKFRGRTLARAVFFLPVIIATGPVFRVINDDMDATGTSSGQPQFSTLLHTDLVDELMHFLGVYDMSSRMTGFITAVADSVFGIVWSSGIQILLFLAALQNIPPSAREAAQIEGATSWEYFWKIVFPYVSPFVLANLIFTVIDSFTDPMNEVMRRILVFQTVDINYGLASAMAWLYFGIILAAIAVVTFIVNKFVYYEVD